MMLYLLSMIFFFLAVRALVLSSSITLINNIFEINTNLYTSIYITQAKSTSDLCADHFETKVELPHVAVQKHALSKSVSFGLKPCLQIHLKMFTYSLIGICSPLATVQLLYPCASTIFEGCVNFCGNAFYFVCELCCIFY